MLPSALHAKPFPRMIALAPHVCEMLYAIGAASSIVGAVSYCDYPAEAKKLPRVGSYQGVDVEAALRLQPDIAVVTGRNVKGVLQLEKLGVTIVVSNPTSFEGVFHDMLMLGRLTGHQQEAEAVVRQQRERLQRVRAKPASHRRLFYELWSDPLLTVGGVSFIDALIREAGGVNVFSRLNIDTPHVNVESVIRAKPEMIIIPDENRDITRRKAFWRKWLGNDHLSFAVINPDLLHRPGPRLIDGLERLQQLLQKAGADSPKRGGRQP